MILDEDSWDPAEIRNSQLTDEVTMQLPFSAAKAVPEAGTAPMTRFAFKLFCQIVADTQKENVVLSPASVMLCLGIVLEAATGETRREIARALQIADVGPEATSCLTAALRLRSPGLELLLANSLWCDEQCTLKTEFVTTVREHFEAEIRPLPFARPESVDIINSWVSERTRSKISEIQSELDPQNPIIAINAIYFKDAGISL